MDRSRVAFVVLWWTVGTVILFLSGRTVLRAAEAGVHHAGHVMLLAVVEALSALIFLVPRTMRLGASGLMLTFALAFALHLAQGQFPADLLIYAASVWFVFVHGSLRLSDLRLPN